MAKVNCSKCPLKGHCGFTRSNCLGVKLDAEAYAYSTVMTNNAGPQPRIYVCHDKGTGWKMRLTTPRHARNLAKEHKYVERMKEMREYTNKLRKSDSIDHTAVENARYKGTRKEYSKSHAIRMGQQIWTNGKQFVRWSKLRRDLREGTAKYATKDQALRLGWNPTDMYAS